MINRHRASVRILGVVAVLMLAACGGSDSTTVTSPTSTPSFLVVFSATGGTYTATLNNQTYTASGGFTVSLPAGTYQIAGSFRGSFFGVGFGTIAGGGALSGSVRSISGPAPMATSCGLIYDNFDTPTVQRSFQIQFQVTTSANSACQGF
jgi:hypothetical protein